MIAESTAAQDAARNATAPTLHAVAPDSDLTGLLQRVSRRDEAALRHLYQATSAKLYGLAQAMLGNAADAEEVVCDSYVQAWRSAARFDPGRGSVLAWLLMMCRSRALDLLRQRRSRAAAESAASRFAEEDTESAAEDLLHQAQAGTAIHQALDVLSPLRRHLVALAFFRGLSHQEIARAARLPIGTVKSHLRRSLQGMRAVLEGEA